MIHLGESTASFNSSIVLGYTTYRILQHIKTFNQKKYARYKVTHKIDCCGQFCPAWHTIGIMSVVITSKGASHAGVSDVSDTVGAKSQPAFDMSLTIQIDIGDDTLPNRIFTFERPLVSYF